MVFIAESHNHALTRSFSTLTVQGLIKQMKFFSATLASTKVANRRARQARASDKPGFG